MKLTEQQIQEAAEQHSSISRSGSITALQESAFIAGAKWALEQDPWISVRDRLEQALKPEYMNDVFTWKKIEDAIIPPKQ